MTWSILARDPGTGLFGIAIASKFFAVGAPCPWARGGAGIIWTQALVNPVLGHDGLAFLEGGMAAGAALDALIAADDGRDHRQLHVMDWQGRAAAHTGAACISWCGHETAEGLSVAGNMLAGPGVVEASARAYRDHAGLDLVARLLAAMRAGEAAGGDKRGRQAAAILIQGPEPYARLSLRVDDHADPLAELGRLADVARERYIAFTDMAFPTDARPSGVADRAVIEAAIERDAGKPLGRRADPPDRGGP